MLHAVLSRWISCNGQQCICIGGHPWRASMEGRCRAGEYVEAATSLSFPASQSSIAGRYAAVGHPKKSTCTSTSTKPIAMLTGFGVDLCAEHMRGKTAATASELLPALRPRQHRLGRLYLLPFSAFLSSSSSSSSPSSSSSSLSSYWSSKSSSSSFSHEIHFPSLSLHCNDPSRVAHVYQS